MTRKVLFIDRDGTLIEEPPDQQVDSLAKLRLVRGVIPALARLRDPAHHLRDQPRGPPPGRRSDRDLAVLGRRLRIGL